MIALPFLRGLAGVLLPAVPLAGPLFGPSAQDPRPWIPLDLPALCRPTPVVPAPLELVDGVHLRPLDDDLAPPPAPVAPLPAHTLLQLVEEDLRRLRLTADLELAPGTLLVRGEPRAVEAVGVLLDGLRPWDAALRVDLEVELGPAPGGSSESAPPNRAEPRAGPRAGLRVGLRARVRVRSGERVALGARRRHPYLGDYDVNVTSDAGVAEPDILHAMLGATVHLTASRLEGGHQVLLEGLLDLAQLEELERFDPDTPDLGVVEEPRVAYAQVAFAARVSAGETARVELRGLPLDPPDWDLSLTPRTRTDPPTPAGGWVPLDVAAIAHPSPFLPAPNLGFGGPGRRAPGAGAPGAGEALPAGTLARLLGGEELSAAEPLWSERLLLLPPGDPGLLVRARDLVRAVEAALQGGTRLAVERGATRVSLPAVAGRPVRVLVGREFRRLVDYRTQLAPESWMPQPEIARFVDGFCLQGRLDGALLTGAVWAVAARDGGGLEVGDVGVGRLQRVMSTEEGRPVALDRGDRRELLAQGPTGPPIRAVLETP